MSSLLADLRFALRTLAKTPGFAATAIVTLALAIGVNSAIFALINGLVLRPVVPYKPDEVVSVFTAKEKTKGDYRQFSHAEFEALRASKEVFADAAAINFSLVGIGEEGGIRRSFMFMVSENFFDLMGVHPAAGRFFTAAEARPNANLPVVVTSYNYWQRAGGRPDFIGSKLRINGVNHTVVGVTPPGFSGISSLLAPDVWMPLGLFSTVAASFGDSREVNDLSHPRNYTLNVMARLQPGLTLASARPRLPVLAARLNALLPPEAAGDTRELQVTKPTRFSISTSPENDGPLGLLGGLMLGMAGLVLVIAGLNLANMQLARGTARAREMAVRLALGATRAQIVRQLLVEGLVLALAGGLAGLLLSIWTNRLLEQSFLTLLSSMNFSLAARLTPDPVVIAVTFGFCLLATLIFSLGPALRSARADLVHDLKAQAGDPAVHGRFNRFFAGRHLLVMAQMTLSLVLLFTAGLFVRGALQAANLDKGFSPDRTVLAELDFSLANTPQAEAQRRLADVLARVQAQPDVEAAGLTTLIPYGNITNATRVLPASAPAGLSAEELNRISFGAIYAASTPGYLASIGVPILRGRDFTEAEARQHGTRKVCLIDDDLAAQLFPGKEAVGQLLRYTQAPSDGSANEVEVVGVVGRHRHDIQDRQGAGVARRVYVPLADAYSASVWLSVRLRAQDPRAVLNGVDALRRTLRAVDPDLPILQILPFSLLVERSITLWISRLGAVMFGVFGAIALLMAVVGVYGVKAYAVERRTREIGIRMALGADRGAVFGLIMRQGALQIAVSTVAGIILALLTGRVLASLLTKVSPSDPLALGGAVLVLTAATLIACFLPARRATRVSPLTALRSE